MAPRSSRRQAYHLLSQLLDHQIFGVRIEGETPSSRLKQYAVAVLALDLHSQGKSITLTQLTEITGLTRGALEDAIDPLVTRGVLAEAWVKNSMGRGKAREFSISNDFTVDISQVLQDLHDGDD
ncbi:MarR family transcriptional regulator (plasmid) [Agrobacterium tumefaciens]|nr:MarR family transcriptional regulator [Agrobacterium tumefaciens]